MLNNTVNFKSLIMPILAMFCITSASNYLVEIPISDWITWGTFPYPLSFLVTELTNRFYGPKAARKVVYFGFVFAVILAFCAMNQRIALASSTAFLIAQLLDISVFNRFRHSAWWMAPWFASVTASAVDTSIFFSMAFVGESLPWVTWALGDFAVKLAMDLSFLLPFRLALWKNNKASLASQSF